MDKVLQAYTIDINPKFNVFYQEKSLNLNGITITGALYKYADKFYCVVAYIENRVYTFHIINSFAGMVDEEVVMKIDYLKSATEETYYFLQSRFQILNSIAEDRGLPSVLNVAYDGEFLIYYRVRGGALKIAGSRNGVIYISLPPSEQIRLADTLAFLNIKVEREYGVNDIGGMLTYDR